MSSPFTGGLWLWDEHKNYLSNSLIKLDQPNKPKGFQSPSFPSTSATGSADRKRQHGSSKDLPIALKCLDVKASSYGPPLKSSALSVKEKVKIALSIAEECIQPNELETLFERESTPVCYDGFEPSGRMHIAQGILKAINVNKLTRDCGCIFVFWIADWFAMLNNKMGGDLAKIQIVGKYFIEVWKAVGMDMNNVRFLWASEEINRNPSDYWTRMMDVSRRNTISRVKRCCQIMGRTEGDDQPAAHVMYPCMQCADIFYLKADICQLGMDQRKVNMLAREYAEQAGFKQKPIILSHPMLPGLLEGQEKMSKSNPDSAIFMEDSVQEVNRKIKLAYCPPKITEGNPCITYVKLLVFPYFRCLEIKRKEAFGGDITYTSMQDVLKDYEAEALHPGDLKTNLARLINTMLDPVRKHFTENAEARDLLRAVQKYSTNKE